MTHFIFATMQPGQWRRLSEQTAERARTMGATDEARPHFCAVSERGESFVALDRLGLMGRTGLCPGEWYDAATDTWRYGYRFLAVGSPAEIQAMLCDLNDEVERLVGESVELTRF